MSNYSDFSSNAEGIFEELGVHFKTFELAFDFKNDAIEVLSQMSELAFSRDANREVIDQIFLLFNNLFRVTYLAASVKDRKLLFGLYIRAEQIVEPGSDKGYTKLALFLADLEKPQSLLQDGLANISGNFMSLVSDMKMDYLDSACPVDKMETDGFFNILPNLHNITVPAKYAKKDSLLSFEYWNTISFSCIVFPSELLTPKYNDLLKLSSMIGTKIAIYRDYVHSFLI